MSAEVVTVDEQAAVVRVEVDYGSTGNRWRDLWVLRFAEDGRYASFEEWPFALTSLGAAAVTAGSRPRRARPPQLLLHADLAE